MMVTMDGSSGCRRASLRAAATLQPLEIPQKMPSSLARRRAMVTLSSVVVVVSPRARREKRALRGLDGVELDGRVVAPQIAAHPGEEAARALRVDEGADAAAHLLVDLRPRAEDVRLHVVGVVELPGDPVASGIGGPDLLQLLQREIHVALPALGEDEPRPVGAHDLLALLAHALGHDDGARVALQ